MQENYLENLHAHCKVFLMKSDKDSLWYALQHMLLIIESDLQPYPQATIQTILATFTIVLGKAKAHPDMNSWSLIKCIQKCVDIAQNYKLTSESKIFVDFKQFFAIDSLQGNDQVVENVVAPVIKDEIAWLELCVLLHTRRIDGQEASITESQRVSLLLLVCKQIASNPQYAKYYTNIEQIARRYKLNVVLQQLKTMQTTVNNESSQVVQSRSRSSGAQLGRFAAAAQIPSEAKITYIIRLFDEKPWATQESVDFYYYILPIAKRLATHQINSVRSVLDAGVAFAEQYNLLALKYDLSLTQAECLGKVISLTSAEPIVPITTLKSVLTQLHNYMDALQIAQVQKRGIRETIIKINQLETNFNFQIARPWLMRKLLNKIKNQGVEGAWQAIEEIGSRYIAFGLDNIAWCFYGDIKKALSKSNKSLHDKLNSKLVEISFLLLLPSINRYQKVLDSSIKGLWEIEHHVKQQCRQQLKEAFFAEDYEPAQIKFSTSMRDLVVKMHESRMNLLLDSQDDQPLKFAHVSLGSFQQLRLAPFSDLESFALVEDKGTLARLEELEPLSGNLATDFLEAFFALFRFALGTEIRGLRFDEQGNPCAEGRLYGNIAQLIKKNLPPFASCDDNLTYSLLSSGLLFGDSSLLQDFQVKFYESIGPLQDALIVSNLKRHLVQFKNSKFPVMDNIKEEFDFKAIYRSPLIYFLYDCCLFFNISLADITPTKAIHSLIEQNKVSPLWGNAYRRSIVAVDQIRARIQHSYNEQKDIASCYAYADSKVYSLSEQEKKLLYLIELALLVPNITVCDHMIQFNNANILYFPEKITIDTPGNAQATVYIKRTIALLILSKADMSTYRSTYLHLPPFYRSIFDKMIQDFGSNYLSKNFLDDLKVIFADCPTNTGERKSEKAREAVWLGQLKRIVTPSGKEADNSLTIEWAEGNKLISGTLHPYIVEELRKQHYIDKYNKFKLPNKPTQSTGRHHVPHWDVTIDSQRVAMHMVIDPDDPSLELSATTFTHMFIGWGVPYVKLAKLISDEKEHLVLIRKTIDGIVLTDGLLTELERNAVKNISSKAFSQRYLTSTFVLPEDHKFSNSIITTQGAECFDNERVYVLPVVEENNRITPVVKDFHYLHDKAEENVHPEVVEDFLALDKMAFIEVFFKRLELLKQEYTLLINSKNQSNSGSSLLNRKIFESLTGKNSSKESFQPFYLPPYFTVDIYTKFSRLVDLLTEKAGKCSNHDMLDRLAPYLASYYQKILRRFPDIVTRFTEGFAGLYGVNNSQVEHQTLKLSVTILATLHGRPVNLKSSSKHKVDEWSYDKSMRQLKSLHDFENRWHDLRAQLYSNDSQVIDKLEEINGPHILETLINNLDFSFITPEAQVKIFDLYAIKKVSFNKLAIYNSTITDEQLEKLLQSSTDLKILILIGCINIGNNILRSIARYCPIVETIVLQGLKIDNVDNSASILPKLFLPRNFSALPVFSELRFLDLSSNFNLTSFNIVAPNLVELRINDCQLLTMPALDAAKLQKLGVKRCMELDWSKILKIVKNPSVLSTIDAEGCAKFIYNDFYSAFPFLLSIDVGIFGRQRIDQLKDALTNLTEFKELTEAQISHIIDLIRAQSELIIKFKEKALSSVDSSDAAFQKAVGSTAVAIGLSDHKLLTGIDDTSLRMFLQTYLNQGSLSCLKLVQHPSINLSVELLFFINQMLTSIPIDLDGQNTFIGTLNDKDLKKRELAILLLARFKPTMSIVDKVVSLFNIGNDKIKFAIIYLLYRWGGECTNKGKALIPVSPMFIANCLRYISDIDATVAYKVEQSISIDYRPVISTNLKPHLATTWQEKLACLENIKNIDSHHQELIAFLVQCMRELNNDLRQHAIDDLGRRGCSHFIVITALFSMLGGSNSSVSIKTSLLKTLGDLVRYNPSIIQGVKTYVTNSEYVVRHAALDSLNKINFLNSDVLDCAISSLKDSYQPVRLLALEILQKFGSMAYFERSIKRILDNNYCVTAEANKAPKLESRESTVRLYSVGISAGSLKV